MITGPAGQVSLPGPVRLVTVGGEQGVAGPPGAVSGVETFEAAENIAGHRAVGLDEEGLLLVADSSAGVVAIGVIRDAVTAGNTVTVYRASRANGFAGLTPAGVYYLSTSGQISLTPPGSGVLQVIGTAASATELLVVPGEPVTL